MNFDKIIPVLKSVAPSIASALGGPLAGMAVTALGSVLGIDMKADPAAFTDAILTMPPDVAARVRAADQDFAVKMKALDIDLERLAKEDRESARAMQVATRDPTPRIIGAALIVGFFSLLTMLAFRDIPTANHDVLLTLIGVLGACVTAVVSFYFGSSAGSRAKDETIKGMQK